MFSFNNSFGLNYDYDSNLSYSHNYNNYYYQHYYSYYYYYLLYWYRQHLLLGKNDSTVRMESPSPYYDDQQSYYFHDSSSSGGDGSTSYSYSYRDFVPFYDELVRLLEFTYRFLISPSAYETLNDVFSTNSVLILVLSGFGTVTNALNLVVFRRQGILKDGSTTTLAALALSDFLSCLFDFAASLNLFICISLDKDDPQALVEGTNGNWVTPRSVYIVEIFKTLSSLSLFVFVDFTGWLTAYLALERMVSVTFPFRVKAVFTTKVCCVVIVSALLGVFLLQLPRFIDMTLQWVPIGGVNGTLSPQIVSTGMIPHKVLNSFTFVVRAIVPLVYTVIIVVCNVIVCIKVNTSRRFRKSQSQDSRRQRSAKLSSVQKLNRSVDATTKDQSMTVTQQRLGSGGGVDPKDRKELRLIRMMYLISFTFLLARIPLSVSISVTEVMGSISEYWQTVVYYYIFPFFTTLEHIGSFLLLLNGATHIFIYYALSGNYRKTLAGLYKSCCNRNEDNK